MTSQRYSVKTPAVKTSLVSDLEYLWRLSVKSSYHRWKVGMIRLRFIPFVIFTLQPK